MAFAEQARAHGLSEDTIKALLDEGYDNTEDLMMMEQSDMDHLKIKRAQHGRLRKWKEERKASGSISDEVDTTTSGSRTKRTPEKERHHTSGSTGKSESLVTSKKDIQVDSPGTSKRCQDSPPTKLETPIKEKNPAKGSYKLPSPDDIIRGLDEETAAAVKEYIEEYGAAGVGEYLEELLSEYSNKPINIAITGSSGAGKSSFINCVRGLTADDVGAAEVDVVEATKVPQPYPHPDNDKLILWDLPGVGTKNFPKATYLKDIEIDRYDLFLIMTNTRFTENDLFLAKEVHELGKRFFMLRTKIDLDIDNDKTSHPRTHNPIKMQARVKKDLMTNLDKHDLPIDAIFLISTRLEKRAMFDFSNLMGSIVEKAPDAKKTSLILSLMACSEEAIRAKKEDLGRRIPTVVKRATLETENDSEKESLINKEIELYRTSFGLTEEAVVKMGVDPKTLSKLVSSILGGKIRWIFGWISDWFTSQTREEDMETAQKMIEDKLRETLNKCASASEEIISKAQKSSVDATI